MTCHTLLTMNRRDKARIFCLEDGYLCDGMQDGDGNPAFSIQTELLHPLNQCLTWKSMKHRESATASIKRQYQGNKFSHIPRGSCASRQQIKQNRTLMTT